MAPEDQQGSPRACISTNCTQSSCPWARASSAQSSANKPRSASYPGAAWCKPCSRLSRRRRPAAQNLCSAAPQQQQQQQKNQVNSGGAHHDGARSFKRDACHIAAGAVHATRILSLSPGRGTRCPHALAVDILTTIIHTITQLRGLERVTDKSTMYLLEQGPSISSSVVVSQAAFQNWLCEQNKQWMAESETGFMSIHT